MGGSRMATRPSMKAAPTPRLSVINSEHPAGVGLLVPIPRDFEALKLEAPTVAAGWQESVIGVMDTLCRLGRRAVNLRKSEDSRFAEYLFNL